MTRPARALLVAPAVVFLALFAAVPVAVALAGNLVQAGGLTGLGRVLGDPVDRLAVANSLVQGGISAGLATALGYPAGIFLGRYDWRGAAALRSVLLVPFLLPSLVVVLGVRDLLAGGGWLGQLVPSLSVFSYGVPGIVLANLVFNLPLVVLLTASACETASVDLEETVATLGGAPARRYRDVWGPPSWIGAAAGGLLTFLFSALSFAPPLLLCGDRCYTVEARIWSLDQVLSDPNGAGVLALVLLALFALPTAGYLLLLSRLRPTSGRASRVARTPLTWSPLTVGLALAAVLVVVGEGTLLLTVVGRSLSPPSGGAPGGDWTALFGPSVQARLGLPIAAAVANSLLFAGTAAGIVLLIGLPTVLGTLGGRRRSLATSGLLFLPLLVSPVVLAFSLATFWRPLLGGAESVWLLVILSQATLALPFAVQSLSLPARALSPAGRDAASSLGASPMTAFLDVDLPQLRRGLLTAGLFAFAIGLGEFTATFFLVTPRFTTLSVALYDLVGVREAAAADAAAGLLVLLSLGVFVLLSVGGRRVEF